MINIIRKQSQSTLIEKKSQSTLRKKIVNIIKKMSFNLKKHQPRFIE